MFYKTKFSASYFHFIDIKKDLFGGMIQSKIKHKLNQKSKKSSKKMKSIENLSKNNKHEDLESKSKAFIKYPQQKKEEEKKLSVFKIIICLLYIFFFSDFRNCFIRKKH